MVNDRIVLVAAVCVSTLLATSANAQAPVAGLRLVRLAPQTTLGEALGPALLENALKTNDVVRLLIYGELVAVPGARADIQQMLADAGIPNRYLTTLTDPDRILEAVRETPTTTSFAQYRLTRVDPQSETLRALFENLHETGVIGGPQPTSLRNPPLELRDEVEFLEKYRQMNEAYRSKECQVGLCIARDKLSFSVACNNLSLRFTTGGELSLSATSSDGSRSLTISSSMKEER
jgi:hypothetical protein